jgi:nitroreductase
MSAAHPHLIPTDRSGYEAVVRDPCNARHFHSDEVPRSDIEHMVELAMCAASTCPGQVWRFIAITDRALIAAMQTAVLERFEELALKPGLALQQQRRAAARAQALMFAKAPLCIAVLAMPSGSPIEELMESACLTPEEHDRLCVRPELQSAGAAVQLLTTSAHAMGYATCWTCAPLVAGDRLEQLLRVESPARLVALVAVGRASEQPVGPRRLSLEETLAFR